VKAVRRFGPGSVGIIGGGRTIRSGYYRRELNKAGIETRQRIAQPLSILVERGEVRGVAVDEAVSKIIRPLKGVDAILLACTHYPVLSDVISKYAGPVRMIDPVKGLYNSVRHYFNASDKGRSEFLTTGNTRLMIDASRKAFAVRIRQATRVKV
jgi:glutamate racemase